MAKEKCEFRDLIKEQNSKKNVLITNVNIFNGKDETLLKNMFVKIQNDTITEVSSSALDHDSQETTVINGTGKTLMPGLVDSHVHVTGSGAIPWRNVKANINYNLSAYLYAGITTVYDLGGISSKLDKIRNNINKGKVAGPDLYHTHIPVTVKDSHPIPLSQLMLPWPLNKLINLIAPTINKTSDAKKIVNSYVRKKVDYMKLSCDQIPPGSPEMPLKFLKALVDKSHEAGKKVFVHIGSVDNALTAVNAGADILAHGIWRDRLTEAQADQIKDSGIQVVYTLAGFSNVDKINRGEFEPSEMDEVLIPCCVLHPVKGSNGLDVHKQKVMNAFFQNVSDHRPHWEHNFKLLYERSVPILVGTDSSLPGTYAGATYYQELELLNQFGMSPFEVLRAATYGNSRLFLDNPDFGTVETGKKANLLLINGNPLENIKHIEKTELIIKAGRLFERVD